MNKVKKLRNEFSYQPISDADFQILREGKNVRYILGTWSTALNPDSNKIPLYIGNTGILYSIYEPDKRLMQHPILKPAPGSPLFNDIKKILDVTDFTKSIKNINHWPLPVSVIVVDLSEAGIQGEWSYIGNGADGAPMFQAVKGEGEVQFASEEAVRLYGHTYNPESRPPESLKIRKVNNYYELGKKYSPLWCLCDKREKEIAKEIARARGSLRFGIKRLGGTSSGVAGAKRGHHGIRSFGGEKQLKR